MIQTEISIPFSCDESTKICIFEYHLGLCVSVDRPLKEAADGVAG